MKKHKKSHYVCTYDGCRKEFSMELMLKKHIKCFHKESTKKRVPSKFVCPIEGCDRVYNCKRNVNEHILRGHSKRTIACTHEGCDKAFSSEKLMKKHISSIHEAVKVQCDWPGCGLFCLKSTIKSHRLRHQNQNKPKPLVCNHKNCGQKFTCSELLREHIHDVHYADKLLTCRRFGCTFETYKCREMRRHYSKHKAKKWLSCDWPECSKILKTKSSLEEHINAIHKNIKPYICPEPDCEYRTAYKTSLLEHAKTQHKNAKSRPKIPCDWPGCTYEAKTKRGVNVDTHCYYIPMRGHSLVIGPDVNGSSKPIFT